MKFSPPYTLGEVEALTGFDRRTIAYYVSLGLLPKVGRRGARTRYPQSFVDRLLLIRRIRELQDNGQLPAVTLTEIGEALDRLPVEELGRLARDEASPQQLAGLFDIGAGADDMPELELYDMPEIFSLSPGESSSPTVMAASGRRAQLMARTPPAVSEIGRQLRRLERRAMHGSHQRMGVPSETLTRVPVSDHIMLSVTGLSTEQDRKLAEHVAALLARLLDTYDTEPTGSPDEPGSN